MIFSDLKVLTAGKTATVQLTVLMTAVKVREIFCLKANNELYLIFSS